LASIRACAARLGVIDIDGNRLIFVGCGSVEPPEDPPLASACRDP